MPRRTHVVAASALSLAFAAGAAAQQSIRFAAFGDYGQTSNSQTVATRVLAMNPDFICTTGDNTYSTSTAISNYDGAVGQYYRTYIQLPAASAHFAFGSPVNKFWPVLGNHDWDAGSASPYINYFIGLPTTPANRRYYTFTRGPIQFFMLDSDTREPDGVSVGSAQYNWFVAQIGQSAARWKIVMFHHPFQTSTTSSHGPSTYMNWGFENFGVNMVLQGHNHTMERLLYNGVQWFVTGAGGQSHYTFTSISPNSQFRNSSLYGFSMVTATNLELKHEFISAAGAVLDTVTVPTRCAGNVDGNATVDFNDLNLVLSQFGSSGAWLAGDINGDGVVTFADLNYVLTDFGRGC